MLEGEIFINKLNQQDVDAFHSLYTKYYKVLVLYGIRYLESADIAEDVVQDVFSSIWAKKIQFQSIHSLQNYLYTSVRNTSLDYLKHKQVENKYVDCFLNSTEVEAGEVDSDDEFCEEEIYRRLFDMIDKLPPRCKEVFLLYMKGKKNEEIASALAISFETVKTQKKRAMKMLRKMSVFLLNIILP